MDPNNIAPYGFAIVDGKTVPIEEIVKNKKTISASSLDLQGYEHPLPAGFTSVGGLNLRGYEHPLPDWIISAGEDSRGYTFAAVLQDGEWRIRAGCRDFSIDEALEHWGPDGESDNPECLALVEKLKAEIKARNKAKMEIGS